MNNNTEVQVVNTTIHNFFYEYLIIKKPAFEAVLSKIHKKQILLNPKILKVFALLLYYNFIYRNYEESVKWKLVFDYDTKVQIMKTIEISEGQLNTYLSILRSLRLLNGRQINQPFIFYPEDGFELTYKFIFIDEKQ